MATAPAAATPITSAPARTRSPSLRLTSETVDRLHCAGMGLADAEHLISDRLTAERVRNGILEIDGAIRAIQSAMLEHLVGHPVGGPTHRANGHSHRQIRRVNGTAH